MSHADHYHEDGTTFLSTEIWYGIRFEAKISVLRPKFNTFRVPRTCYTFR